MPIYNQPFQSESDEHCSRKSKPSRMRKSPSCSHYIFARFSTSATFTVHSDLVIKNPFRCYQVLLLVAQSCPTPCDPMGWSPPASVHGILQARIPEWVVLPFSRGASQPRDGTLVSCIAGRFFTVWATGKSSFPVLGPSNRGKIWIISRSCLSLFP